MRDTWLTGGSNPFKASNNLGADMITSADGNRNPSIIDINGNRRNPYVGGAVSNVVGNTSLGSGGSGGSGGGSYGGYSYSGGWVNPYELDLSAFQRVKDALISSAEESKGILKGQYDRLLADLDKKTKQGNEQFGQGRATIAEDAYDRSRANLNNLASRGLAGSGLQQLGEVQERMETGQQMNDLASQYYAYLDDLDSQRTEGEARYQEGIANIENALEQQLAQIGLQEFQAQDDYNRYMTELALQNAMASGYSAIQGSGQSAVGEMDSLINGLNTIDAMIAVTTDPNELANLQATRNELMFQVGSMGGDISGYLRNPSVVSAGLQEESKTPTLTKEQEQANFREWQNKNAQNISNVFSSIGNAFNNYGNWVNSVRPSGNNANIISSYRSQTNPYFK